MPTYEYACRDCGEHVEVVQSFKDAPLTTCGLCGGSLRKVFSAAGIVFKGSGYYVTDSRKKPASESAAAEKSDSKTGGSDGGGSSETAAAKAGDQPKADKAGKAGKPASTEAKSA